MGLGADAFTVASHVLIVVVLVLLGIRVLLSFRDPATLLHAEKLGLSAAIAVACLAVGAERVWFVVARSARGLGHDLYGLHPVPELMSALVAGAAYAVSRPILRATRPDGARVRLRLAAEALAFVGLWALLVLALR